MKRQHFSNPSIAGFSLIELLIASLINSIILLGTLSMLNQIYALKHNTFNETNQLSNLHVALDYLADAIAQASPLATTSQTYYFYTGPCGSSDPCTSESNDQSQIAVVQPLTATQDCTGQTSNIDSSDRLASVFKLLANNGQLSLYCRGYNLTQQAWVENGHSEALVDGITSLKAVYLQQSATEPITYQYYPSAQITNWQRVVAVKLSVTTTSRASNLLVALVNNSDFLSIDYH